MEDILKIGLLIDFYGSLLTNRQFEMLDLHYNRDCSLSEIADCYGVTRQAAFDNIKRGRNSLFELESRLKLVDRYIKQRDRARLVLEYLDKINKDKLSKEDLGYLVKIKEEVRKLSE